MQVSKNFDLKEFINKKTWALWGDRSLWFIDQRVVNICQWIRNKTGRCVTVNDWDIGGKHNESGMREFSSITGSGMSQHKFGRAADIKVEGMESEEVRQLIRENYQELNNLGLTTIEKDTPAWVHFDVRFTGKSELNEIPYQ